MPFASRKWIATSCMAALGFGSSGCLTQALMESNSPEALVFLPATLTFDLLAAAVAGSSSPASSSSAAQLASYPSGPDPDDWVGECRGPVVCPEHQHFVCEGSPGECSCRCETTVPEPQLDGCVLASPLAHGGCRHERKVAAR